MNVNFNTKIKSYNGQPLKQNGTDMDFHTIVCQMLYAAGEKYNVEEKYKAYKIMQRIEADPEHVEVSNEDAVLIKRIVGDTLTAGAYGQLADLLEKGGEA